MKRLKVEHVLNTAAIGLFVWMLLRPSGPATTWWLRQIAAREIATEVAAAWSFAASTGAGSPFDEGAGAELMVFSDYECPYCREDHVVLRAFLEGSGTGTARLVHLPLVEIHPSARDASLFAICAEFQGRFSGAHRFLMENRSWQEDPDWEGIATEIGVPAVDEVARCMGSDSAEFRLNTDLALADSLGLRSTPAYVGIKKIHRGLVTSDELAALVEGN
jgi:protein-disulfide isomerase